MEDMDRAELEKYREQRRRQIKRQNTYAVEHYDRITLSVPAGCKDRYKQSAAARGFDKLTPYIVSLIEADISAQSKGDIPFN